ncbi:unnamed protein product [Adineta ricciae]|uniref:Uncharacterized protein n=1 Tax=Adineta ricciae TaxID=249248 RepID=A0A815WX45_ADIRI|nr:unnamed protein product [Adineta ricciae]CAF1547340.1 unnamed protein product [Adineta ricciae]
MWRLANCLYRAFRNVTSHRCPQDIIVPIATICKKDDESKQKEQLKPPIEYKSDIDQIIKTNKFLPHNFQRLIEYAYKVAIRELVGKPCVFKAITLPKIEHVVPQNQPLPSPPPASTPAPKEDPVVSLLQADEGYMTAVKALAELNEETMANIQNEMALDAIESGNVQLGIEALQASAKSGKNAAALYNLGICHERGIGVAADRAKACDYYRQAAMLGHVNAQYNLTLLSNQIDDDDSEDEIVEQTTITTKSSGIFRFSFLKDSKEDSSQPWNDYSLNFTKTLACLS